MAGKTRKQFHPARYFQGLSTRKRSARKREIERYGAKSWKDPSAYRGFKTDEGVKTRPSSYTERWRKQFPGVHSLTGAAKATGIPLRFIEKVFNRGMAAWRTGHRPGATEQQWGYARVYSFLLCGKTHYSTDADIVKMTAKSPWWKKQRC